MTDFSCGEDRLPSAQDMPQANYFLPATVFDSPVFKNDNIDIIAKCSFFNPAHQRWKKWQTS